MDCPNPPVETAVPNGFLLAASSLGLPPRPLKNPPPADEPAVLAELEPNRLPPDDGCCCPNMLPLLDCWPNTGVAVEQPKAEGCPKLNPEDEDVVVLLPNTDACPNPELWPNAGAVLCPNRPEPVLLDVLALLVPKEKELALLAVEAPKRPPPPVVAALELAPNADWPKEKPPGVPVLLAGWPKPLTWPNTDLPKPVPVDAPNPAEPNPVDAGAEETGGAAGCPNTVLAVVVAALFTTVGVAVVEAGAAVMITGVTPRELLSVVAGAG